VDEIRRIADAVLYEGYVLWPYSRAATKNQRRWTFGGVYPEGHADRHPDDPFLMQTECLVEGEGDCRLDVRVRFLHVVARQVARARDGGLEHVDELTVGAERHVSWDEAVEREVGLTGVPLDGLASGRTIAVDFPAGESLEKLHDASGRPAGALARSWRTLHGTVGVASEELRPGLHRLSVRIVNTSPFEGPEREQALRQTFCSAHTVLHTRGGRLVSQTDPPRELREEAAACCNAGAWPVLVGAEGERHTVLSSPIILPDYPRVAPESPGDMFDAAEIDQLLRLSILSMTDAERREMRATDPRTREILERTESLSAQELMRLHGAVREFGLSRRD
jgi:hydrogenase maturation protease